MSFQDVGPPSPRQRAASSSPPDPRRSEIENRATSWGPVTTKRPTSSATCSAPPPNLRLRCPVTSRYLMYPKPQGPKPEAPRRNRLLLFGNDTSTASDSFEEQSTPHILPTSERVPSIYSQFTKEIVNYQKMVAELETLLEPSSKSPEAQWRSRILMHSARDADRDIWKQLYEYETMEAESDSRSQMACRKLHRDFQRVHNQFMNVLEEYDRRQQVHVSFLASSKAVTHSEEKKEDFFDRAMREREDELHKIRSSMNKVNDIYSDLAALVQDQQDHVDEVAENLAYSRATTEAGADFFRRSTDGLCGSMSQVDDGTRKEQHKKEVLSTSLRITEDFSWTMPFETIQDDIKEVQKDIAQVQNNFFIFGKELYEDLADNVHLIPAATCAAGSEAVSDESKDRYHPKQTIRLKTMN